MKVAMLIGTVVMSTSLHGVCNNAMKLRLLISNLFMFPVSWERCIDHIIYLQKNEYSIKKLQCIYRIVEVQFLSKNQVQFSRQRAGSWAGMDDQDMIRS